MIRFTNNHWVLYAVIFVIAPTLAAEEKDIANEQLKILFERICTHDVVVLGGVNDKDGQPIILKTLKGNWVEEMGELMSIRTSLFRRHYKSYLYAVKFTEDGQEHMCLAVNEHGKLETRAYGVLLSFKVEDLEGYIASKK